MPSQIHGNKFQDLFADKWTAAYGKRGWVHRFPDAADVYGRNKGRMVNVATAPADFLCGAPGWMGLVECKATVRTFSRSLVKDPQIIAATKCRASNSPYFFAVKNETTGRIYMVPGPYVLEAGNSLAWSELDRLAFEWRHLCPTLTM